MRVSFAVAENSPGGPTRVAAELATELSRLGHQVEVTVPLVPHWSYHQLVTMPRLSRARQWRFLARHALRALRTEANRNRGRWVGRVPVSVRVRRPLVNATAPWIPSPDVWVLCNDWYQLLDVAPHFPRERVVQFVHHVADVGADIGARRAAVYTAPTVKVADSRTTAVVLRDQGIKIDAVVPLGVRSSVFHPPGQRNGAAVLMYCAEEPRKGAAVGVAAMTRVRAAEPHVPIRLLGRGQPPQPGFEVVDAATDSSLADLLRSHSVFVYPSLMEGFGLPPLEAMACGCAVVSSRVGAIEEYAADLVTACLVEPGNAQALAEATTRVLRDPTLAQRLSRAAPQAARRHTWERAARALCRVLPGHGPGV